MKSSQDQRFTIESFAGVDLGQLAEKPPRSRKLVAYIDFGSGPGGGDYRTYFLSTDKERSAWYLWLMVPDFDTGKRTYGRVAYGSPYRGHPAKYAAKQLLTKTLEDDRDVAWVAPPPWSVMEPGLLDSDDIRRIGLAVFGADHQRKIA
jgi:hypothetical protein